MKEYFIAKKAAKAQVKALEERKQAEIKENERFGKMLTKYFDFNGRGLSRDEINEVNTYLKEYVVLADEKEINNYTTLILTYTTVAKNKLAEIVEQIRGDLDNGQIIDKENAVLAAKNVIISRPSVETSTVVNGKLKKATIVPEKKYTINIDLDSAQVIQTTKYEHESEDGMRLVDNQISKWENVRTLAYTRYRDDYNL